MMFKQAAKRQNAQARAITTKYRLGNMNLQEKSREKMLDVQSKIRGPVGVVRMNREHRNNMLTPNFIHQVKRGVESFELDHSVRVIYLTTVKGQNFSNGTDFRTMMHYKAENEIEKMVQYLGDIFNLQASFAKINKPILAVAPGQSFNSGASLLGATGLPAMCNNSRISFNECQFGFVPHAGSCYYTSRLPGDLGTFLMLTGFPLAGRDAIELNMADMMIQVPKDHELEVQDTVRAMDPTSFLTPHQYREADDPSGVHEHKQVESTNNYIQEQLFNQTKAYENELRVRSGQYHHDEPFMDYRERKPDMTAGADIAYEQRIRENSIAKYGVGGVPFFEHDATMMNIFQHYHDFLKMGLGETYHMEFDQSLLKHKKLIDRCFWYDTVEEIQDALRRETDPFAAQTLQRMEANSMLSMKISLKMLREAKNMAYGEVLKMELNTALNKATDAETEFGIRNILMKPNKDRIVQNPGFAKEVSNQQVQSYFETNKYTKQIDLDIVENALLPTRDFFSRYTDSLRIYINETSSPDEAVRNAVDLEIKDALRTEGINLLDKTVTIPQARHAIMQKIKAERKEDEFMRRSAQMATDQKLRKRYFDQINDEVAKIESDPKLFYDLVNKNVSHVFEQAYLGRLKMIYDKSKEAHNLKKRRMFIKFKKFLMKSRLLSYINEETDRLTQQVQNMPFKMIHMTEDWTENHRQVEHPDIQQSVMWHLSKVVGKANLAPAEMMKDYLTNPQTKKDMTAHVFDQNALKALRKDLIENPEKYESILAMEKEQDPYIYAQDHGTYFEKINRRRDNWYHTYKMYNDGRGITDVDNWPMEKEYLAYKVWADDIKHRALGTLQFTVNRLLIDFENSEELNNKVVEFDQGTKESKRAALTRLQILLNEEVDGLKPEKKQAGRKARARMLHDNKHKAEDLKKDFFSLINSDPQLSKVFGSEAEAAGNSLIGDFREELLGELLQLVEIVMLQNTSDKGSLDQKALEERIGQLIRPANGQRNTTAQLRHVDTFLAEQQSQKAIKKAIGVIKPFFLQLVNEKLQSESARLLSGMRSEESKKEVFEHYLLHNTFPELKNHPILQRIEHYHEMNEKHEAFQKAAPLDSMNYTRRRLLGETGQFQSIDASVTEQEAYLEENTREQLKSLNLFDSLEEERMKAISEEQERHRQDSLKVPFDQTPKREVVLRPEEQIQLDLLEDKRRQMRTFVDKHEHEMETLLSTRDWLAIYNKAILDHRLDMNELIRKTEHPDNYLDDVRDAGSQIKLLNQKYGKENLEWNQFAQFSGFLEGIHAEMSNVANHPNAKVHFEKVVDFMNVHAGQTGDDLGKETLLRSLMGEHYTNGQANLSKLSKKVKTLKDFNDRVLATQQLHQECLDLAAAAPAEMKEQVETLLNSGSKYLDRSAIKKYLKNGKFIRNEAQQLLNRQAIIRDARRGNLADFLAQCRDMPLDVASVEEMRTIILDANRMEKITEDVGTHLREVMDLIDQQLSYVSNERRQQLTLGDFIEKYHVLNSHGLKRYSSDLLKNQIQQAMGLPDTVQTLDADKAMDAGQVFEVELDGGPLPNKTLEDTLRHARVLTELSPSMEVMKNLYENRLLSEYTAEKPDEHMVERLVQEYTQARIHDAMVNPEFAAEVKSGKSDTYMKMLRENIMDELKLTQSGRDDDFHYSNDPESAAYRGGHMEYDPSNVYNMHDVNNENAIGYNNLYERAGNIEKNHELAHESVFDQVLADYFLKKRGDIKQSSKLLNDLTELFNKEGHSDNPMMGPEDMANGEKSLGEQYLRSTYDKLDRPELLPYNLPALMDLDLAVNRRLNDNKAGLSGEMRELVEMDVDIPDYFDINDPRKPASKYVRDVLEGIVDELFSARKGVEKHLSRRELTAYDQVLAKYLKMDQLLPKLKREINMHYNALEQQEQSFAHKADAKTSDEKQLMKERNKQSLFNKDVVNEDAYYKLLAYSGQVEKNRRENRESVMGDAQIYAGFENFETFYTDQLIEDARRPARVIDPEVYRPKRAVNFEGLADTKDETFLDMAGRRDHFVEEHKLYKENKLEQNERIELFYLLEQMNQNGSAHDVNQAAQESLQDYFSKPENTFFYEKNKIR